MEAGDERTEPVRPGQAPAPAEAAVTDWSHDHDTAALGTLVEALGGADRLMARAVDAMIRIVEDNVTESVLGVAPEILLSQTCRAVGFERRTLLRVASHLVHMPATRRAFRAGDLSWSQIRAVVTAVGRVNRAGRDRVDDLVAELAPGYAEFEADHLIWEVDILVDELVAVRDAERERDPVADNRLVLTPRLDGSGTAYGEYDSEHFPLLAQSVDNQAADRYPFRDAPDLPDPADTCDAEVTAAHRHAAAIAGRNAGRRACALFELVTGRDAVTFDPLEDARPRGSGRPSVRLTCHVDTLLDGSSPAWLLSPLAGRMRVTSDVARRWLDAAGADARLVAVDDVGEVVGVGRRQRFARGWLREAVLARDLHDTAPCSTTPAMVADVDHVQDWDDDGTTDVTNLAMMSRRFNAAKQRGEWTLTRHADGTRTWTATRSGYTVRQARPAHLPRSDPEPPAAG
ncbi:HNH endonuclease [Salsipaludibacter albus]|uniref:HNH endonuclease n=1 Tax=Salsipaludibacter albus TaxID=2849650 RepID=UPI001EE45B6F|nr:13E12 repeat family protein [Salsipaludibacter albus]MBY5163460.1 13E12 repeat family protein [Salsipaludibacter albus]